MDFVDFERSDIASLYRTSIAYLKDIKLCFGPTAVTGTLRKRKGFQKFLREYQTSVIDSLDNHIASAYNDVSENLRGYCKTSTENNIQ